MVLGITGTRNGATAEQRDWFLRKIQSSEWTGLVHGGARGVDKEFHDLMRKVKGKDFPIVVYPGQNNAGNTTCAIVPSPDENTTFMVELPYMVRNRRIVGDCDFLMGFPMSRMEVLRSGTWSAIRYARKTKRRYTVVDPDGQE